MSGSSRQDESTPERAESLVARLARLAVAPVLTLLFAKVYLSTLTTHSSPDSIAYALIVERVANGADPRMLLDPHHPFLHPLALAAFRLAHAWLAIEFAIGPLQVVNALAGAVCVGFVTASARRLSGSTAVAAVIGLGFGFSGGLWMLSVDAEFVTVPLAFALAVVWALFAASRDMATRTGYAVALALGTAVAFFAYISGALLAPVVVFGFWLDQRLVPGWRVRQILIYSVATVLAAVPLYVAFLHRWSGGDLLGVPQYFLGSSYAGFRPFDVAHGGYAMLRSLALYPGLGMSDSTRDMLTSAPRQDFIGFASYYLVVLLVVVAPFMLALHRRRALWPWRRRELGVLAVWASLSAVFAVLWVPGDVSFWMPVLASWWLFVAVVINSSTEASVGVSPSGTDQGSDDEKPSPLGLRQPTRLVWLVLALAVTLGVANARFGILPRRGRYINVPSLVASQASKRALPPDLVVVRPDDMAGTYLAVKRERQVAVVGRHDVSIDDVLDRYASLVDLDKARRVVIVDTDETRRPWWDAFIEGGRVFTNTWELVEVHTGLIDGDDIPGPEGIILVFERRDDG